MVADFSQWYADTSDLSEMDVVNDHYNLHGLPVSYDPRVRTKEWVETHGGDGDLLIKEYTTPVGSLRAEVRKTSEWPWGDHVPVDYALVA